MILAGSGFAEGASTVLLGAQGVDDVARNYGLDVYSSATRINLVVPVGAPTGQIRVSTVGGTSAAFGIGFSAVVASAGSGTAANAQQASANPGQTITLQGSALDASTDVVFQIIDGGGNRGEQIVRPNAVNAQGTEVQVVVPINARSGAAARRRSMIAGISSSL